MQHLKRSCLRNQGDSFPILFSSHWLLSTSTLSIKKLIQKIVGHGPVYSTLPRGNHLFCGQVSLAWGGSLFLTWDKLQLFQDKTNWVVTLLSCGFPGMMQKGGFVLCQKWRFYLCVQPMFEVHYFQILLTSVQNCWTVFKQKHRQNVLV